MSTRVRFAPSPTGHLHVGNARTALFNYLFAASKKGKFILRIEDTDLQRSSMENEEMIYEDMNWLGFYWDEGPRKGGDYGPYRQTERFDLYKKYADKLLEKGHAYKCFCSKEELEEEKEKALAEGRPPRYSGKCRNLSEAEVEKLEKKGIKPSIRFKVNKENVLVSDEIRGDIDFRTDSFGDFIIVRPDGTPVYNFVVVIDDALMKISHVIRGDDHLSNTPKQVLMFEAMGFDIPKFAHIPMILGPDHSKLSKRHGVTSINVFRDQGYLPEALFNYLALLSWSDENEREILSREELAEVFSLERVSKSAAVFDFDKLKWMNGIYIRNLDEEDFFERVKPFIVKSGVTHRHYIDENSERVKQMALSVRDNLDLLSDIGNYLKIYFEYPATFDEQASEILSWETTPVVINMFKEEVERAEEIDGVKYKEIVKKIQKEKKIKGKPLFMAIRVGLSGKTKGPEVDKLVTLLDKDELLKRLTTASAYLSE
ncbi:MAG: glutamate--tRNA ligase [Flexistipes sinusarabici]|uniref:Glutamate--tRNA ligase n=1 Tax=Flexistipes sinusarabici TaxID=2352 RepID=A0A5D0MQZ4_FLESI|nr:glutamate--tRNA ligase [Flexistipes sinusarabici]TYB33239.1 MAG: glutamate--tRNA ligase [Flexistipes sinusarabici]